jgi:hypothetical protein
MYSGFCMARIATSVLRIISVHFSTDVSLAIAAQVFVSAGVVLIYIINLIFAQRLMRAAHPNFGWHVLFSLAFKLIYVLIILTIIMVIVVAVQSFYTLSPNTHRIDRYIQLSGVTYFAFVSFIPLPLIGLGLVVPRRHKLDKFGEGRWRTQVRILMASSFLICFGASYRAGTMWLTPVPRTQPLPWYFHKAAFYLVNFGVEVTVVWMYAILRVHRRFLIPNGAHGPGSYSLNAKSKRISTSANTLATTDHLRSSSSEGNLPNDETLHDGKKSEGNLSLPALYTEEETFDMFENFETTEAQDHPEGHPEEGRPKEGHPQDVEKGETDHGVQ